MRTSRTAALALFLALPTATTRGDEPLVEKVKRAIDKGVRFLREQEKGKGNWEERVGVAGLVQKGGVTALAVVALLEAGVPPDDPILDRRLKYLRSLPPEKSYTVGLQTMAFSLAGHKQDRQRILQNVRWMEQTRLPSRKTDRNRLEVGGWGYDRAMQSPDHSINEF